MDLRLYGRVLWRFRIIVLVGFLLAVILTLLTFARVSFEGGRPSLEYREQDTWSSSANIFITQRGFPLLRSVYTDVIPLDRQSAESGRVVPALSDPNRFAMWAELYAGLATSDAVQAVMLRDGPVQGAVLAEAQVVPGGGPSLPLVRISGLANSPEAAIVTARRGIKALLTYVKRQQDALGLPIEERVLLKVLNEPVASARIATRSKTRPVVVFLAAMMAVIGLVFVLENLRPRLRPLESEVASRQPVDMTRRSA